MATILVVDDDVAILKLLSTILIDESGHRVIAVSNGQEALDMLRREPVDAVVCDANMPVMNGIELVRAIRTDDALKDLPVVMVSAEMHHGDLDSDCEVDLMLEKPFEVNSLIACVSFVLGRVRAGQNSIRVTQRKAASSISRMIVSTSAGKAATS